MTTGPPTTPPHLVVAVARPFHRSRTASGAQFHPLRRPAQPQARRLWSAVDLYEILTAFTLAAVLLIARLAVLAPPASPADHPKPSAAAQAAPMAPGHG